MGEIVETLGLTYQTIYQAYKTFFDGGILSDVMISLKVLAIALFLLSVGTNMIEKTGQKWTGNVELPYDKNKFLVSLFFVIVIASFDKVTLFIDSLLIPLDTYFQGTVDSVSLTELTTKSLEIQKKDSWMTVFKKFAVMQISLIKGDQNSVFLAFFFFIAKIIDAMIYVVFLVERFFFLGLIKILGPFAILFSIFEAKKEMFMKWLKLYFAVYLLIIPFYLILGFSSELMRTINNNLREQNPIVDIFLGKSILTVALFGIIWIKLRLFKKSYDIVYKIMA